MDIAQHQTIQAAKYDPYSPNSRGKFTTHPALTTLTSGFTSSVCIEPVPGIIHQLHPSSPLLPQAPFTETAGSKSTGDTGLRLPAPVGKIPGARLQPPQEAHRLLSGPGEVWATLPFHQCLTGGGWLEFTWQEHWALGQSSPQPSHGTDYPLPKCLKSTPPACPGWPQKQGKSTHHEVWTRCWLRSHSNT